MSAITARVVEAKARWDTTHRPDEPRARLRVGRAEWQELRDLAQESGMSLGVTPDEFVPELGEMARMEFRGMPLYLIDTQEHLLEVV